MWFYLAALLGLYLLRRWYREKQTVSNLTEKYVFITGCDSGFGNLLARQLDARGLPVLAACLTQQGAEKLKEATSQRLQTTLLDVCSTESVVKAAEWVKSIVGDKGLWGLVNNAGISVPTAPNEWLTKGDFQKVLDINLLGLIDVTIHMLPLVRKAKGRIINISSVMGRIAFFGGGYCPSKYGVQAFSDSLRREMSCFGVKVCIIEPGYFQTMITNEKLILDNFHGSWERLPKETKQAYSEAYLQKLLKETREIQHRCSSNLSLVTNCMVHALTAEHPRTRYSAGWDAKLIFLPMSYIPTGLTDWFFALSYPKPIHVE
ncbi:retinol dehydrogenase 16-like [Hemicordylus capensis]|uniref:retinol dehydrogenase 16-like n=1 Tax=Hemicordylus capensis TaxID=884348 RepID=UPI0023048D4A|nr:retinol dehydrogenase 16-like [Hemicordylus capensis]XP_053156055.1 retinol dehydrogenase 16-like [Hemicordylus capensis]XP_053156056.1 retinol dehydrogenase 16-like [Hemicordylus capensis]XP_053156057.1 retinol dehydrogenase 16-like [Hemicordylus capensis]